MDMTMQRAAQSALDVQTACNLSGIVQSLADITAWMRTELKCDTPTCNEHPVCRLFAEAICSLTGAGMGDAQSYSKAYDWCQRIAKSHTSQEVTL